MHQPFLDNLFQSLGRATEVNQLSFSQKEIIGHASDTSQHGRKEGGFNDFLRKITAFKDSYLTESQNEDVRANLIYFTVLQRQIYLDRVKETNNSLWQGINFAGKLCFQTMQANPTFTELLGKDAIANSSNLLDLEEPDLVNQAVNDKELPVSAVQHILHPDQRSHPVSAFATAQTLLDIANFFPREEHEPANDHSTFMSMFSSGSFTPSSSKGLGSLQLSSSSIKRIMQEVTIPEFNLPTATDQMPFSAFSLGLLGKEWQSTLEEL